MIYFILDFILLHNTIHNIYNNKMHAIGHSIVKWYLIFPLFIIIYFQNKKIHNIFVKFHLIQLIE